MIQWMTVGNFFSHICVGWVCPNPRRLMSLLQNIYEGDVYVLVDGDKTVRAKIKRGVKQGCLLSPILFALYISDSPHAIRAHTHRRGAKTGLGKDLIIRDFKLNDG